MSDGQYFELRTYSTTSRKAAGELSSFLRDAEIPAYGRLGIGPVGVFTGLYGPDNASITMLLPHDNLDSVVESRDRVHADPAYREAGKGVLDCGILSPAYIRFETRLLRAFAAMPRLEPPAGSLSKPSRIFEMRTYEGHSVPANKKKIEMFNEGGEIEIFRRTGLTPVFFGETVVGPRMPNLTYMVMFDSFEQRAQAWQRFTDDPEWKELRNDPQYADTVSTITDVILQPAPFSQF